MPRIIEKFGFYYVVSNYGRSIYTYAVCDTREKAERVLLLIDTING